MLTIVLVTLAGLLLAVNLARHYGYEDPPQSIWSYIFGIILGATIGIVISAFWGAASSPTKWEEVKRIELYGLSNGLSATGGGRVFVQISPTNAYTYWYAVKSDINGYPVEDSFRSGTAWGSVQIIQDERQSGSLTVYRKVCTQNIDLWRTCSLADNDYHYLFHVPKGTVAGTFELK